MYNIMLSKQAVKHIQLLKSAHLETKTKALIEVLQNNPFQNPPPYEKLTGEFNNLYLRRINYQHRLVYEVYSEKNEVRILSMWTHYETI